LQIWGIGASKLKKGGPLLKGTGTVSLERVNRGASKNATKETLFSEKYMFKIETLCSCPEDYVSENGMGVRAFSTTLSRLFFTEV